jgi:hypothetical protein
MVMSKIRLLAIVWLGSTIAACTIDQLPPRPNQDAATDMAAGMDSRAGLDAPDTATSHPDSSILIAPELGSDASVESRTGT